MGRHEDVSPGFGSFFRPRKLRLWEKGAAKNHPSATPFSVGPYCSSSGDPQCEDQGDSQVFDIADELEKGLVDEPMLAQAARSPSLLRKELQRCSVFYKELTGEYHLLSEAGDLMLVAQYCSPEHRVEFYTESRHGATSSSPRSPSGSCTSPSSDASPRTRERRRPVFVMSYNEVADEWVLQQSRCELCAQRPRQLTCEYVGKRQQVARIRHSRCQVRDALVHHLSVYVPPLLDDDGTSAAWCPLWTGKDLGERCDRSPSGSSASPVGSRSPKRLSFGFGGTVPSSFPGEDAEAMVIQSLLPEWDKEVECLVLNFKGRHVVCSVRNFMLRRSDDQEKGVIFQHAKMSNNMWCLDFRHPLSPVQAFGIAMSSLRWD